MNAAKVWQTSGIFFLATRTRQCCQMKQPGASGKPEKSFVLQDYQPLLFERFFFSLVLLLCRLFQTAVKQGGSLCMEIEKEKTIP